MLKYWFSLQDLLDSISWNVLGENPQDYLKLFSVLMLGFSAQQSRWYTGQNEIINLLGINEIDYTHMKGKILEDGNTVLDKDPLTKFTALLILRYGSHYVVSGDSDETFSFQSVLSQPVLKVFQEKDMLNWAHVFVSKLMATYPKYYHVLKIYEDNIAKLMDPISKTSQMQKADDYTITADGKTLHNDTPESTDVLADIDTDQHVSDLSKSHGVTTNKGGTGISTSEDIDTKYAMEKIAEIQDSYQMILAKWVDEFSGLFIEEENI